MNAMKSIVAGFALMLGLFFACDGQQQGGLGLDLRFAQLEQAQTAEAGLPVDVLSIQVDVLDWYDGSLLADSGCLDVAGDEAGRAGLQIDLVPNVVKVRVRGYADAACALSPEWSGSSARIVMAEGEENIVPIYVTRRGLSLNPIRSFLPHGRAFATATPLVDGRILVAGGFSEVEQGGAREPAVLKAACDAWIYDPGLADFTSLAIPLVNCRGLHRALAMEDGSVWLIGGATQADLEPVGGTRPILRPSMDNLVGSVERYDPQTGRFELLKQEAPLARAQMALGQDGINGSLIFGGRSTQLRSRDILSLSWVGDELLLGVLDEQLSVARAGAESVTLGDAFLVFGGQMPGESSLEMIDALSREAEPVDLAELSDLQDWSLTGHALSKRDDPDAMRVLLTGGMPSAPASVASNVSMWIEYDGQGGFDFVATQMDSARAYHAAVYVDTPESDGLSGWVLAGGLGVVGMGRKDMEMHDVSGAVRSLDGELATGSLGISHASLPDGSILLLGGLDVDANAVVSLVLEAQILAP